MIDRTGDKLGNDGSRRPRHDGESSEPLNEMLWDGATRDMTDRIMTRLGYERVDEAKRRQAARRRLFARGMTLVTLAAAALVGVHVHRMSDQSRTPRGATIDSAMSRGVAQPIGAMEGLSQSVPYLLPLPAETRDADHRDAPESGEPDDQSRVPWSGLL